MLNLPVNPKTGKHDGIFFTFGGDECSLVLAERLLTRTDDKTFRKVTSKLTRYMEGLRLLAQLPECGLKNEICLEWRNKYVDLFSNMLTDEQGRTFLLNIAKARYQDILIRNTND